LRIINLGEGKLLIDGEGTTVIYKENSHDPNVFVRESIELVGFRADGHKITHFTIIGSSNPQKSVEKCIPKINNLE